jgi:6-phosphogluconolactonase
VVNELDSTLARFTVDDSSGSLELQQRVPTIPGDFTGENFPADVQVAQSGNAVYVSNRGHNSIAVFTIGRGGEMVPAQYQPTGGAWPRSFTIDPTGRYLLVANQRSDTITVLAIDPMVGTLAPIGHGANVPVPVCLRFL